MKLIFVHREKNNLLTFSDIESVHKSVPDADIGFLYYLNALTVNSTFRQLIREHRKEFGIPENGFEYKDKKKVPFVYDLMQENFNMDSYHKSQTMLRLREWKRIKGLYIGDVIENIFGYISLFNRAPVILKTHIYWYPNLDVSEDDYKKFRTILKPEHRFSYEELYNSKFDPSRDLLKSYEDEILFFPHFDMPFLSIQLNIDSPSSLNSINRYLKKNWKDIEYYLSKMESYNEKARWKDFYISERDIEIVEMHRFQNKTFREIGDYYETLGNFDLYEDNVKTAYHRAIKKIDDLIIPEA